MTAAEILVVDDDETIRIGLKRLLESRGYQVALAPTAEYALEILKGRSFDLVLTDLQMPGIDGLELLRQIKSRSEQTPVVMITAHAVAEYVIQALRSGASDFVPKPYQPAELLLIVAREAARGQSARQAASQPPAEAPSVLGRQISPAQMDEIDAILAELRVEAAARCILLVEGTGHIIDAKGAIDDLNISALAALVAGDFAATSGIASLIGEGDAFRLNYHEGSHFSIYTAHLTPDLFLLVVFGQEVKSGMVLYVTRQALPRLREIIQQTSLVPLDTTVASPGEEVEHTPLQEQLYSLDQILESDLLKSDALDSLEEQFRQMWQ